MDGTALQAKVYRGYAMAASKIGVTHSLYRANGANNPTAGGNLVTTLPAAFSVEPKFARGNKYGNALWQATVDGSQTKVGDYLVGPQTWFIAEMAPLLPIMAVLCNRTLNFSRPAAQTQFGALGYSGTTEANETPTLTQWPGSVLQGYRGEKGDTKLPGDVRLAWWTIYLPATGGITLEARDICTDDLGRRFILSSIELSEFGYRLVAAEAET